MLLVLPLPDIQRHGPVGLYEGYRMSCSWSEPCHTAEGSSLCVAPSPHNVVARDPLGVLECT